ncbi:MAG: FecR family protein [Usitatibacter sp.]
MRKAIMAAVLAAAIPAMAADVGQIKVSRGNVQIQRGAEKLTGSVGSGVQASDVVVTGADGYAGITFTDNSLVSVGPGSVFAIDKYAFDTTTHQGEFEGNLRQGRLAAISGKMVKQSPESMKIRTPSAIMGVRGTEFVVQVGDTVR